VVTRQLQVELGTGKVRRSKTGVLPLCNAANMLWLTYYANYAIGSTTTKIS